MPSSPATFRTIARFAERRRGLLLPLAAAALIFVILAPLPPMAMDFLLAGNIALSAVILLTAVCVASPLEFSAFPSILLGATLIRLVLNVATTRLILTAGGAGRTLGEAQLAAGRVVWSFSDFVAAGSLAVGAIVFAIIIVVQFVVVTKGAGRISEVAARFVLDAMPGKQAAIDADLAAGHIDEAEARERRRDIVRQADFYGAMDGASKFLRGDAVAAVIITLINLLGGLYVGLVQYGWSWAATVDLYSRLTIGDGLVTQVPAFIVSISAALVVTRSTAPTDLGEQVVSQLTHRPVALAVAAVFLAVLAATGLPALPMLIFSGGCAVLAWTLLRRRPRDAGGEEAPEPSPSRSVTRLAETPDKLLGVEPIRVSVGYALIPLASGAGARAMLDSIGRLRRQLADELGMLLPAVRIGDNLRLGAHEYRISIRARQVAGGRVYPRQLLAVGEGTRGRLSGREAGDEALGATAMWIAREQADAARQMNYTLFGPIEVLIRHLAATLRARAAELLSREQVADILSAFAADHPHLADEARRRLTLSGLHKVLRELLREGVSIRDLEAILEAVTDAAGEASRPADLVEAARVALGDTLCRSYADEANRLWCVALQESLEGDLAGRLHESGGGGILAISADLADRVGQAVNDGLAELKRQGRRPVVVCSPTLRPAVGRILSAAAPGVAVLGYDEIRGVELQPPTNAGRET